MSSQELFPYVRNWVASIFQGNLETHQWRLEIVSDEAVEIRATVKYSYVWKTDRDRASGHLRQGSIESQIDAAMKYGSPAASLKQLAQAMPHQWMQRFSSKPLDGWMFSETRMERCDSCAGARRIKCSPCSGSGEQQCGVCGGGGRERQRCKFCHGMGQHTRSRQVTIYNGSYNEIKTETYYEYCWHCSNGYTYENCIKCNGRGRIDCAICKGSGNIICMDCAGNGERIYVRTRKIMVDSSVARSMEGLHPNIQSLFQGNWNCILDATGTKFMGLSVNAQAESGMVASSIILVPSIICNVEVGDERGQLWALGSEARIRDADPILVKAFGLPIGGDAPSWTKVAEKLAGKRVLADAMRAFDEAKGDLKQRRESAKKALFTGYGALLGGDGREAVASAAAYGVNKLRVRIMSRILWQAAGAAFIAGVVIALWLMFRMSSTDWDGSEALELLKFAPVVGPVIAMVGAISVQSKVARLIDQLGLQDGARLPSLGKLLWPWVGVSVLPILGFVATTGGGYLLGWPVGFYERVSDFHDDEVGHPKIVWTSVNLHLRAAPNRRADIRATLPAGTRVELSERVNGDWVYVSTEMGVGWVSWQYLAHNPPR